MGPIFSVTSMRPSGRKAIRQGNSKVAVVAILKGTVASGFCWPTLTWAQAVIDPKVNNNTAFANFIVIFPRFSRLEGIPEETLLTSAARAELTAIDTLVPRAA